MAEIKGDVYEENYNNANNDDFSNISWMWSNTRNL